MSESTRVQMPKGERDEGVERWFHLLDRGIKLREEEEDRWDKNEQFEDLYQWTGEMGRDDEVTVNKLGSYIRTYRAQIAFNDPRLKLTPKNADGEIPVPVPVVGAGGEPTGEVRMVIRAKVREALINDILASPLHNTQAVNSRLVKAGTLGWGCLKSGYEPTFSTDPEPEAEQKIRLKPDGTMDLDEFARNAVDGSLVTDGNDRLIRRDMIPIYEDFFIRWVPYRSMIIDPDGGNDWQDHQWAAEEVIRPYEDVKNDPLYKNTKDLKPSGYRSDNKDAMGLWQSREGDWAKEADEVKKDAKIVRLFEIYDLANEKMIVLADGHGKALREEPLPLGITGHPYSDFRPNEVLGKFYPRPIASDLVPINEWYNIARQMELRAMKRSTRKVLIRRGAVDAPGMNVMTSDEDMAVVEWDNRGAMTGVDDAVSMLTPPPISESIYRNSEKIAKDFDEVGGISEAGRGNATGGTATETNVMEQYSGKRIDFDRKVLAECWRRAGKKLNDSLDANMTQARAIRLEGADGALFSGLADRDLIAGDYDVDVDVEDMAPPNSAMEGAQLIQFIQTLGQSVWIVADETLAREFLAKFGVKNERVVRALSKAAQMQLQMMMGPPQGAPGAVPNAPPPSSEADAIAQAAAGMQAPRMQGAT